MNYYKELKKTDGQTIFMYVAVTLIIVAILKRFNLTISVLIALICSYFFVVYYTQKLNNENKLIHDQHITKSNYIKPYDKSLEKYEDVIDFLFSIQDFYRFNQQNYEEMIDNISAFFVVYENININDTLCEDNYKLMENKKKNALNALHSIIFSLPENKIITNKFNRSMIKLEFILNEYLYSINKKCKNIIINDGYTIDRKILNSGPSAHNSYLNDENFTYDFF